jgi:hypothetical protein
MRDVIVPNSRSPSFDVRALCPMGTDMTSRGAFAWTLMTSRMKSGLIHLSCWP